MSSCEVYKRAKSKAISLLARREYSRKELANKLSPETDGDVINDVLEELQKAGLQSDSRFAESFVRMKKMQGKGPARIRQDLTLKGISGDLLSNILAELSCSSEEDMRRVYDSKYRGRPVHDQKEKARRLRFLVSRGFSPSQIYPLLNM